jgi:hypothetical protein
MNSGAYDVRRTAKRWGVAIVVFTIAAMAVVRAVSVRHRPPGERRSLMTAAAGAGENAGASAARDGGGSAVDLFSVYEYAVCAGNEVFVGGAGGAGATVVGDVHSDARRGGEIRIEGMSDLYGAVSSPGAIAIGSGDAGGPTVLYGSARADRITIGEFGEVRHFENLNEWVHGVDLDLNGGVEDMNVSKTPAVVHAARAIASGGAALAAGDTDQRIADGTQPVEIRPAAVKTVSAPRPDFRAYYEMAAGTTAYPPEEEHVVSEIPGDGGAHYFASASAFLAWINSQEQTGVLCARCGGDGMIGPENSTDCPACAATGGARAVTIAGVFYIDDEILDLSRIETNLVVHGTIVVADGNPHDWPKTSGGAQGSAQGGAAAVSSRYPRLGSLVIGGAMRMNLTVTYRSDEDRGPYVWRHRTIHAGSDLQYIAVPVPERDSAMRGFPALAAASNVTILPRAAGFASHSGDIGDEAMTVIQGVVFAGGEVRAGGRGGWHGDRIVFDEEELRSEDEILDESVFRIDLNDDGDTFDLLKIADVTGRQVIRVKRGRYTIDLDNDGVLGKAVIGGDYGDFFAQNGYAAPVLYYQEGTIIGDTIRLGDQSAVLFDPLVAGAAPLVGFGGRSDVSSLAQ